MRAFLASAAAVLAVVMVTGVLSALDRRVSWWVVRRMFRGKW